MKQLKTTTLIASVAMLVMLSTPVLAAEVLNATLLGFKEVPAISTRGTATFQGEISPDETSISFELSYSNLQGTVAQAHIHFAQLDVNGGIIAFLCGGGGKPDCPGPNSGMIMGTITADDIIGPSGQGIAPGQFREVLRAIRKGVTYANVHTNLFTNGEIRGQIKRTVTL